MCISFSFFKFYNEWVLKKTLTSWKFRNVCKICYFLLLISWASCEHNKLIIFPEQNCNKIIMVSSNNIFFNQSILEVWRTTKHLFLLISAFLIVTMKHPCLSGSVTAAPTGMNVLLLQQCSLLILSPNQKERWWCPSAPLLCMPLGHSNALV